MGSNISKDYTVFIKWFIAAYLGSIIILTNYAWSAGLNVYVEGTYTENNLIEEIYIDTDTSEIVSAGLRLLYDPNKLSVTSVKKDDIWSISNNDMTYHPYTEPDISRPGEIIIILGRLNLSDSNCVSGNRVPLAYVDFERKEDSMPPESLSMTLENARIGNYSNFVTSDVEVLDDHVIFESVQIGQGGNTFQRGDANADGSIDFNDIDTIENYQQFGGDVHIWMDCNDDNQINIFDIACIQNKLR